MSFERVSSNCNDVGVLARLDGAFPVPEVFAPQCLGVAHAVDWQETAHRPNNTAEQSRWRIPFGTVDGRCKEGSRAVFSIQLPSTLGAAASRIRSGSCFGWAARGGTPPRGS